MRNLISMVPHIVFDLGMLGLALAWLVFGVRAAGFVFMANIFTIAIVLVATNARRLPVESTMPLWWNLGVDTAFIILLCWHGAAPVALFWVVDAALCGRDVYRRAVHGVRL